MNSTVSEIINCDNYKTIRLDMLTGKVPTACEGCHQVEQAGGRSKRQLETNRNLDHAALTADDGSIKSDLRHIELRLGNFCNLKCLMCHPYKSSSFASESLKLGENIEIFTITKPLIKPTANKKVNDEIQGYVLERLNEIKLTGGEPFMIPYTYELLEKAVQLKSSYNQYLRITTNGTNIPKIKGKDIFDYIPHFKWVTFNISIEAWGSRNNYIRYPSNFDEILQNANLLANSFPNVSVTFVSTINSLNIGYVDEYFTYPPIVNKKFRQPVMVSYVLKWEGEIGLKDTSYHGMNMSSLPYDIREQYLNKFYNLDFDLASKIRPYIKILENRDHNMDDTKILMSRLKKRDKLRNTNLLDMWPEWEKYYV
jgi:hypothetical protein